MQSGVTARYTLKPGALTWLASLDGALSDTNGRFIQSAIAARAGIHPVHLSKVKHRKTRRLGEEVMSGLVNLAMEHGASRSQAEEELFDFLTAADVESQAAA
jgi:DNA-nicking Smr family endonuclease